MGLDITFYHRHSDNTTSKIAYFRKVNFLVKFFETMGYEINNCEGVEIDVIDCEELLKRCLIVLTDSSKAEELLPTEEGFFFGNTDYNNNYFLDVERVKEALITEILPYFYYHPNNNVYFEIWY